MKQLVAAFSSYDAPSDGLGCFDKLFSLGIDASTVEDFDNVDALILWGGADISPSLYGADRYWNSGPRDPSVRDVYEYSLIERARNNNLPIIGVCRGAQLLCAYAGGSLIQDVDGHQTQHTITTYDEKEFVVNSHHHQMMNPVGTQHELLVWTTTPQATYYLPTQKLPDSFQEPEVVYFPGLRGLAIQCHPEWHHKSLPFNDWLMSQITNFLFFKESL